MTKEELKAWQEQMGYTQKQAAVSLGIGISAYKDWIKGICRTSGKPVSIDKRTGLACSAIVANLEEFK